MQQFFDPAAVLFRVVEDEYELRRLTDTKTTHQLMPNVASCCAQPFEALLRFVLVASDRNQHAGRLSIGP